MSGKIDAEHPYIIGEQGNQPIEGSQIVQPSVDCEDRPFGSITIPSSGDVTPRCRYSHLFKLKKNISANFLHNYTSSQYINILAVPADSAYLSLLLMI